MIHRGDAEDAEKIYLKAIIILFFLGALCVSAVKIKRRTKMPKMKTKRGAAKRFSLTKKGKVKMKKSRLRHILTSKTRKQKRRLRHSRIASKADTAKLRQLLPYG